MQPRADEITTAFSSPVLAHICSWIHGNKKGGPIRNRLLVFIVVLLYRCTVVLL
jgi:hypothetical protein